MIKSWNDLPMKMHNIIVSGDPLFNDMDLYVIKYIYSLFLSLLSFFSYFASLFFLNSGHTIALKVLFYHIPWVPNA